MRCITRQINRRIDLVLAISKSSREHVCAVGALAESPVTSESMFYRELRAAPCRRESTHTPYTYTGKARTILRAPSPRRPSFRGRRWNFDDARGCTGAHLGMARHADFQTLLDHATLFGHGRYRRGRYITLGRRPTSLSLTRWNRNCRGIDTRLLVWLSVWCVGRTYACGCRTRLLLRLRASAFAPAIYFSQTLPDHAT